MSQPHIEVDVFGKVSPAKDLACKLFQSALPSQDVFIHDCLLLKDAVEENGEEGEIKRNILATVVDFGIGKPLNEQVILFNIKTLLVLLRPKATITPDFYNDMCSFSDFRSEDLLPFLRSLRTTAGCCLINAILDVLPTMEIKGRDEREHLLALVVKMSGLHAIPDSSSAKKVQRRTEMTENDNTLPHELRLHIFSFLDRPSLLRCTDVCKNWSSYIMAEPSLRGVIPLRPKALRFLMILVWTLKPYDDLLHP
eukprot:TRINITY_DN17161_c0_g1_i1.p1 TRINITY_DN17161_c0_g1~~TRINITY_DN17161_c0_g1_i1.p1  ORF type:complete len:253 (+),score=21.52 TRINITY_DN17161_c0_g1_i1:30-788(+)